MINAQPNPPSILRDTRLLSIVFVIASLVGILCCAILLAASLPSWAATGGSLTIVEMFCSRAMDASCADYAGSQHAYIHLPIPGGGLMIPWALLGFGYLITMLLLMLLAGRDIITNKLTSSCLLIAMLGGSLISAFLLATILAGFAPFCPLCVTVHTCVAMMLVCVVAMHHGLHGFSTDNATQRKINVRPPLRFSDYRAVVCSLLLGVVITSLTGVAFRSERAFRRQWHKVAGLREAVAHLREQESVVLGSYWSEPTMPVLHELRSELEVSHESTHIVLFLQPGCPACQCFEQSWMNSYGPAMGPDVVLSTFVLPANQQPAHLTGDDPAVAWAHTLQVDRVPAAFVNGRRVPDICMQSATFWHIVGQQPYKTRDDYAHSNPPASHSEALALMHPEQRENTP